MHYFAVFHPAEEKEGGFVVTFPDLPGCVTQGNSFDEALSMAQEALEGYLDVLCQDGDPFPEASGIDEARAKAEQEAKEEGEELHPRAIVQAVPVPTQGAPVRINVSLASHVLVRIDRVAKAEGLTRSGFLSAAARHYIHQIASEDSGSEVRG